MFQHNFMSFEFPSLLDIFLDIEELTRKTGNFKQFDVFLSMLESALDKVWYE